MLARCGQQTGHASGLWESLASGLHDLVGLEGLARVLPEGNEARHGRLRIEVGFFLFYVIEVSTRYVCHNKKHADMIFRLYVIVSAKNLEKTLQYFFARMSKRLMLNNKKSIGFDISVGNYKYECLRKNVDNIRFVFLVFF